MESPSEIDRDKPKVNTSFSFSSRTHERLRIMAEADYRGLGAFVEMLIDREWERRQKADNAQRAEAVA